MGNETLKPCPFCGSDRLSLSARDVSCRDCKASVSGSDEYIACERWNRRVPDPVVVKALKDGLSFAQSWVDEHGGIDGCEYHDRVSFERIRDTLAALSILTKETNNV